MAPKAYIDARTNLQSTTESDEEGSIVFERTTIDGQPYMPTLLVDDDNNDDSIRQVVAEMMQLDNPQSLNVRRVPGGITNRLFHVSGIQQDSTPESVLVRVFGGHGLIDRDVETSTYAAFAKQDIAVGYFGRFGNGRLEEWCGDQQHLHLPQMANPLISKAIARRLGELHAKFVVPDHLKAHHDLNQPPTLWSQLHSWLSQALQTNSFQTPQDTQRATQLDLERLEDELTWLKDCVCPAHAKVGFCHNDLLAGNILWSETSQTVQLIDFEYGGMNYLAYDIANHFNEFAGGTEGDATPDYTLFPSPSLQREFVKEYLATVRKSNDAQPPSESDVEALWHEIQGFILANHLVWGLWGVNQAATEGCEEFDYLQYAKCRIERYFLEKEQRRTSLKEEREEKKTSEC